MTDINELMGSAFVRVKCVALIHFLFISNAMLGMWGHGAYEFYNFLFIIAMFWAMHSKDSIEAIQTALAIDISSIFFDIIGIVLYAYSMNTWAISFVIANLIMRPISCILLYREFSSRGGSTGSVFPTTNSQQRSYQDIDRPTPTVPTTSAGPNALVINISSIVLDVVCIIMYAFAMNGWAITFAIINLLLRPLSCILLYREFNTRGGATGSVFPTTNTQQRSYQDIDRPAQTLPTTSAGPNVASIF